VVYITLQLLLVCILCFSLFDCELDKLPSLSNDLRNLLNSPNYSDVTFIVRGKEIRDIKVTLC
jgi:hypothetical protein